jgi:plasmid stabilization system protein ParE
MAFRVEYSSQAEGDLDSILEWLISQHAGEAALHWFEGLEEAIASLSEMPRRCALAPENKSFPLEVRHLLYGRKPHVYRVIFRVINDAVYILHIWHGRRQPVKLSSGR